MKKHRLAAAGAVLALAAGSFAFAAPALAADIAVPDNAYGVEGASYPDGWFTGNPQPAVAPVDNASGITLTGITQFLYGGILPIATGAEFTALVEGSDVDADGPVTFQYPVFFNSDSTGDLGFTTLRPVPTGAPVAGGQWVSSRAVTIDGEPVLAAGANTFADVAAAFDAAVALDAAPQVLAVGVFVDVDQTALVRSVTFAGNTYRFAVAAAAPAPVPTPIATDATFTG
jgi:hypothetical protein